MWCSCSEVCVAQVAEDSAGEAGASSTVPLLKGQPEEPIGLPPNAAATATALLRECLLVPVSSFFIMFSDGGKVRVLFSLAGSGSQGVEGYAKSHAAELLQAYESRCAHT